MPSTGGIIYAIGMQGTALLKIGSTAGKAEKRLKELQTGQPFPLRLVATVAVPQEVRRIETQVHRFLAQERQRGEWFAVDIEGTGALEDLIVRAVEYCEKQKEQQRLAEEQRKIDRCAKQQKRRMASTDTLDMLQFAHRLREQRKALGLTQGRVATCVRMSPTHYNEIECGKCSGLRVKNLSRLCQVLRVSADYLLGLSPEPLCRGTPAEAEGSLSQA